MFAWSVIYPTKGKHSREREHPLSTQDLLDFRLETAALKYNNSDECECLKNSPLIKVH